jgi:hypothetical protein
LTHDHESDIIIIMTTRLQVLLDDAELRSIQQLAKRRGMTTAEWVRQVLRAAREADSGRDPRSKLEAIRVASRHKFPTGDIEAMLAEIERGYQDAPA